MAGGLAGDSGTTQITLKGQKLGLLVFPVLDTFVCMGSRDACITMAVVESFSLGRPSGTGLSFYLLFFQTSFNERLAWAGKPITTRWRRRTG